MDNNEMISIEKRGVIRTYALERNLFDFFLKSGYYHLIKDCNIEYLSLPDFMSFEIFEEFVRMVREGIDFNYSYLDELVRWLDTYANHPCKNTLTLIRSSTLPPMHSAEFLERLYGFELGKSKCLIVPSQECYDVLLKDSTLLPIQHVTVKTGELEFGILLNAGKEGKYVTSSYSDKVVSGNNFLEQRAIWGCPEYTSILDPDLFVGCLSSKNGFYPIVETIDKLMYEPTLWVGALGPMGPRGPKGPMSTRKYHTCARDCCNIFSCHRRAAPSLTCTCLSRETSDKDVSSYDGVCYANTVAKYLYTKEMFTFTDKVVECDIKPLDVETKDRVLACLLSVEHLNKYLPITTYTIPYEGKNFTTNVRLGFVKA